MNQKFSTIIKQIRKKNNLTQEQLAQKYNVTYQAVSKWENGKNMPDISLLKQISKDFNISLEELLGEKKKTKKRKAIIICIIIIIAIILIFLLKPKDDFTFKTISSTCKNFNISGNIAYNKTKSAIYITNIEYCGKEKTNSYKKIKCTLYEKNKNRETKIGSYQYNKNKKIKLEDFLKQVTLAVDNYQKTCKTYSKNSLYLKIEAQNNNEKITTYKIPITLKNPCKK